MPQRQGKAPRNLAYALKHWLEAWHHALGVLARGDLRFCAFRFEDVGTAGFKRAASVVLRLAAPPSEAGRRLNMNK